MAAYSELRIRFEKSGEDDAYALHAAGPSGKADGAFVLPTSKLELENFALRLSRGRVVRGVDSPELGVARKFGSELFDALFAGHVRDLYRDSVAVARNEGKGLRLTLALTNVPELMHVPWEYLYDDPAFLSISTWTPVVRYLDLPRGRPPLAVTQPLRILGMVSSPSDVVALDVGQEQRNLEDALSAAAARGAVAIDWLERATLRDLQRAVRRTEYHVFHFVGHGGYDTALDDGVLLLEDELGRSRRIGGAQLGTLLADEASLRLAVLNSCEGARSSSDDPYAGVATSLVRREVPAVVAMQFEITDRAALVFAGEFYSALADGMPVDAALAEARKAIFADENDVEWGTPVLYMRVPDGRIFDVSARNGATAEAPPAPPPQAPPARPQDPPARARSRRPWLIGAAALLALGAVAALLALVLGGGNGGPGGTALKWFRRAPDAAVFGGPGHQEMTAAAALSDGDAVAVGYDKGRTGAIPAVWTYESSDWNRFRDNAFNRQGGLTGVAVRGDTIVAVGTAGNRTNVNDPAQDALVLTFTGGSWKETCGAACGNGAAGGGHFGQKMWAVTAWKNGFVAVGYDLGDRVDDDGQRHFDAAVWTSPDGLVWSRVPAGQASLGGQRNQVMQAVTVTSSGHLVAAGANRAGGAIWTSSDGRNWKLVDLTPFASVFGQNVRLNAIAQVGSRLIAVGQKARTGKQPNQAAAWATTDPDGATGWHRLEVDQPDNQRGRTLLGIGPAGQTAVAVGYDKASGRQAAAVFVPSADGFAPIRSGAFAGDGSFEMNAVTPLSDGRLLAVGDGPSADAGNTDPEQDAQIWTTQSSR